MKLNYYETLAINQSATADEIRRAYRILARRYHPDLNPGKSSEERFKLISIAYQMLSDPDKRRLYDSELDAAKKIKAGFAAYERAQKHRYSSQKNPQRNYQQQTQNYSANKSSTISSQNSHNQSVTDFISKGINKIADLFSGSSKGTTNPSQKNSEHSKAGAKEIQVRNVSVAEISITTIEAITGVRKSIELQITDQIRKISVHVPSGVRTGSVLRIHSSTQEDFILIIKVAPHPVLELSSKGLIVNLPITVNEALFGCTLQVPGLDQTEKISIPAGSQSGDEVRLTQKGIKFESGSRGDLFFRLLIQIPSSHQAVGIGDKVKSLEQYYESSPRANLPSKLI